MEEKGDKELMDSCETVWLSVERDLNAKLHSPESLKHGTLMKRKKFTTHFSALSREIKYVYRVYFVKAKQLE